MEFKKLVKEQLGVEVSRFQCKTAKKKVNDLLVGDSKVEYALMWDYADELRRSNRGSTVHMMVQRPIPTDLSVFDRFYVCFKAGLASAVAELLPNAEHRMCKQPGHNKRSKRCPLGGKATAQSENVLESSAPPPTPCESSVLVAAKEVGGNSKDVFHFAGYDCLNTRLMKDNILDLFILPNARPVRQEIGLRMRMPCEGFFCSTSVHDSQSAAVEVGAIGDDRRAIAYNFSPSSTHLASTPTGKWSASDIAQELEKIQVQIQGNRGFCGSTVFESKDLGFFRR
ncbi:hypothetical protein CRG98_011781 [Punica granatum]|uniref:Uncharacterized protein n=1 Tax=Punica granatum TaxID=22663 RepID=A0A2I0KH37_PUNGR|nr:hypothetical protein CRG98_011781 [Punica granatum]